jgi:uncharacterized RmlC-like cupin family protein
MFVRWFVHNIKHMMTPKPDPVSIAAAAATTAHIHLSAEEVAVYIPVSAAALRIAFGQRLFK